jgi:hypothetical protein
LRPQDAEEFDDAIRFRRIGFGAEVLFLAVYIHLAVIFSELATAESAQKGHGVLLVKT